MKSRNLLWIVGGIVVIAAIIALVINASHQAKTYEVNTPERSVQDFLTAVTKHNNQQAADLIAANSQCTVDDIDRAYFNDELSATLISSDVNGSTASVKVSVSMSSGELLGNGSQETHVYRLSKENGLWKIEGIPWPLYDCGVKK